jgi:SEC-C motif domain protein
MSCPCGLGLAYDDCCGRLHRGAVSAATAEQLMRSRYSAFVVGDAAYLLRTWHPSTRPRRLRLDDGEQWLRLEVVGRSTGGLLDSEGTVEFRAHGRSGVQHEVSRFVRDGQWLYVGPR